MLKYKLVIVMRMDLEMGKGKMCVQAGHAVASVIMHNSHVPSQTLYNWFDEGQFKTVVKVRNEMALIVIREAAKARKLPITEVRDLGKTQVEPNTLTCVAIGPALIEDVDKVTGDLTLL